MAKARRAFQDGDEDCILDITPSAVSSPRRGAKRPRLFGKFIAPIALSGLVIAGSFAISSKGSSDQVADPTYSDVNLGVSRGNERTPLPSASESSEADASAPAPCRPRLALRQPRLRRLPRRRAPPRAQPQRPPIPSTHRSWETRWERSTSSRLRMSAPAPGRAMTCGPRLMPASR